MPIRQMHYQLSYSGRIFRFSYLEWCLQNGRPLKIHSFMQAKRIVAKVGKDQLPQHLEIKSKACSHAGDMCLGRMTESQQEWVGGLMAF